VSALNIGLVCGEDFLALGWNSIDSEKGIYMASSNATGLGLPKIAAGTVAVGNVSVDAPFTYLMGKGGVQQIFGLHQLDSGAEERLHGREPVRRSDGGKGSAARGPTGLADHPVPGGRAGGQFAGRGHRFCLPGTTNATLSAAEYPDRTSHHHHRESRLFQMVRQRPAAASVTTCSMEDWSPASSAR